MQAFCALHEQIDTSSLVQCSRSQRAMHRSPGPQLQWAIPHVPSPRLTRLLQTDAIGRELLQMSSSGAVP